MFFKKYIVHENKLSEQLSDDSLYKKKLIQMETPAKTHPIYTGLVLGLLVYSWIFFIVLFYKQINQSALYNLKLAISFGCIILLVLAFGFVIKKIILLGLTQHIVVIHTLYLH